MLKKVFEEELNELTPEERKTLGQFGKLPLGKRARAIGMIVVLMPLIILFAILLPLVFPLLKRSLKRLPQAPRESV